MRKTYITYCNNLQVLSQYFADNFAQFEKARIENGEPLVALTPHMFVKYVESGDMRDIGYLNVPKTKTYSLDLQSIALLKVGDRFVNEVLRPCIEAGVLECFGCVEGELYTPDDITANLTENEWLTIETLAPQCAAYTDEDGIEWPRKFIGSFA